MRSLILILLLALPLTAIADVNLPMVTLHSAPNGTQSWNISIQVLLAMMALTLLPAVLLMMTSFTRIAIVLAFLRQAIGTAATPPNQVILGLALFLTFFIMAPILTQSYHEGVEPYLDEKIPADQALPATLRPLKHFMLDQTRDSDLHLFAKLAHHENGYSIKDDIPIEVVVPAFVTSELKTAFQMGFLIFIPFLIIDLIVSSVLMSMGMMMVSPMIISLPFKIMLFVLVDGWSLLIGTLASSFVIS